MVKKYILYTVMAVILASCQKEELTNYDLSDIKTVLVPDETESPDPEPENDTLDPTLSWIQGQQAASGLLTSSENFDFVSLYDNALAAILFIKKEQLREAELILDFFDARLLSELETETGGFYQFRNASGENGSRRWLGDNAWLLITLNHYHHTTNTNKYALLSERLQAWIRAQQDIDGGLLGGYNEDGTVIPKVTEGMITAFNAIPGYDDFHKGILEYLKNHRWDASLQNLNAWPENELYTNALDILALSQSIFEDFPPESLDAANELFLTSQPATIAGVDVLGYCFDEDKDVIWLEGTAQMAVAYKTIGNTTQSEAIKEQIEKTFIQGFSTSNSKGIPYTTNYGTNYGTSMLWDHTDVTPALSSTAWYLFLEMDFNPLLLGQPKNIPVEDMFWVSSVN